MHTHSTHTLPSLQISCNSPPSLIRSPAAAQTSTITWGGASYGELGYGPGGKKSSANPDKVPSLEGLKVLSVACGAGHTVFLLDAAADASKLPLWSPPADAPPADADGGVGGAGGGAGGKAARKRKPAGEAAGGAKKGK
jgi:hypothetical protein